MNKNQYIDESGDIGYTKKSTKYFIITAISTDDIKVLRHIAKEVQRYKKDKKHTSGLHAYKENKNTKNKLIEKLKIVNVCCVVSVINKHKISVKDPYFLASEKIAKYFNKSKTTHITIARFDTRKDYNKKIVNLFKFYNIDVTFSNPELEKALQIADFYSWSVFSHLELDNSEYFIKLKNTITLI